MGGDITILVRELGTSLQRGQPERRRGGKYNDSYLDMLSLTYVLACEQLYIHFKHIEEKL